MRHQLVIAAAGLWLAIATSATAGIPSDQVRGATDRILKLVQDPTLKDPGKAEERRRQIRAVANEVFDWQETGKRALARHWDGRSPAERAEFAQLFADLLERAYVNKIETYSGERIQYLGDSIEGEQATVRTKLVTKSGAEIPIDYRLVREETRWRVYDVLIEGVSLVGNYRNQFNRIIQQAGYPELLKRLRTKQDELMFEDGKGRKPS